MQLKIVLHNSALNTRMQVGRPGIQIRLKWYIFSFVIASACNGTDHQNGIDTNWGRGAVFLGAPTFKKQYFSF